MKTYNVPRVDSLGNNEGWGTTGYLFEKASSNLLPYSGLGNYGSFQAIHSTDRSRCSVVTEVGRTCIKVIGDNAVFRFASVSIDAAKVYTYSFWIKAASPFTLRLANYSSSSYNSETYSITTSWQRITKTFIPNTGVTSDLLHFYQNGSGNLPDIFIADFQLEEGSVATSYIPTTNAIGVRLADKMTSQRPIAMYPKNSFYMESDRYTGWFGNGVAKLENSARNLLLFSNVKEEVTGSSSVLILTENLIEGGLYTISFDVEVASGTLAQNRFMIKTYSNDIGTIETQTLFATYTGTAGRQTATFTTDAGTYRSIRVFSGGTTSNSQEVTAIISNVALVKGEFTGVPWSPAPEELVRIDSAGNITVQSAGSERMRSLSLVPRELTQEEI